MDAEPLSKALYDRAVKDGVMRIELRFKGGDDQGYLNVILTRTEDSQSKDHKLEGDIEEWAWEVYDYSGAGDGSDYGDDIVYDLINNKVTTQEWCHIVSYGKEEDGKLIVNSDD